jgi:hypothetical protein
LTEPWATNAAGRAGELEIGRFRDAPAAPRLYAEARSERSARRRLNQTAREPLAIQPAPRLGRRNLPVLLFQRVELGHGFAEDVDDLVDLGAVKA